MTNPLSYKDKYITLQDEEHLYGDIDLFVQKIVEARYVKSNVRFDNGNMMIEALPRPREGEQEIFQAYNRDIGIFSEEDKKKMKEYEKLSAISLLRQLRFPLPFHQSLETVTYLSLLNSYRNRKLVIPGVSEGIKTDKPAILKGNDASATSAGFSLLGYSGCGKSSALEILLSNYPQTIIHKFDGGYKITQIVYLVVNCVANSNFAALYTAIGKAIDTALGNQEPVYETMIRKTGGLGEKANVICNLIEIFSVGIIIFDEIQLINFTSTKENSVEGLMTIANKTKVAMGVVGTEDAFNLLFSKLRTGRRFGETILGHEYCKKYEFFKYIVHGLFNYQWFDQPAQLTDDICKALFDVSHGIIDQLIGIYIFMQIDYIVAKRKPKIDADYVKRTAEKHYPGMMRLVNRLEDPVAEKRRIELLAKGNTDLQRIIAEEKEKQASQVEKLMKISEQDETKSRKMMLAKITQDIMDITDDYDMNTVMAAVQKELGLAKNRNASIDIIRKSAFKSLQKQTESVSKKPVLDGMHIDMMKDILEG